jgi:hypothetical protein
MNKSKEEFLKDKDIKRYVPETIVGLNGLRLMLLGLHMERRHREDAEKAYAKCEKAYKEYQKHVRLVKQVTKEES